MIIETINSVIDTSKYDNIAYKDANKSLKLVAELYDAPIFDEKYLCSYSGIPKICNDNEVTIHYSANNKIRSIDIARDKFTSININGTLITECTFKNNICDTLKFLLKHNLSIRFS